MDLLRSVTPALHRLDHAVGKLRTRRNVLVELRTPVYQAVLGPIVQGLESEADVRVWYTSENPERISSLVPEGRCLTHAGAEWRRWDLYINGDPWAAARLRRCAHRVNFFHGVAGKYDLDAPAGLPMGFEDYTHVAFINRDRMLRYLAAGVVNAEQAVLVGYPKLDRLAAAGYDTAAIRAALDLAPGPTALYAPTYSTASSLHVAGEAIVTSLVEAGFNVIVKLHDRSLDPDPRYTGGIDWRRRFAALADAHPPGRVRFRDDPDASPLMAVSDLMVTDHSSAGFEFLVLDRPLIVFDAPDLERVARINPDKTVLLRRAATVARTPREVAASAAAELRNPLRQSTARRRVARDLFFDAGRATQRSLNLLWSLLSLPRASGGIGAGLGHGEVS